MAILKRGKARESAGKRGKARESVGKREKGETWPKMQSESWTHT